jgi:ribosome-binding factor A
LRRTPEVIFLEDRSLERGDRLLNLLKEIGQDRKGQEIATENSQENVS